MHSDCNELARAEDMELYSNKHILNLSTWESNHLHWKSIKPSEWATLIGGGGGGGVGPHKKEI